MDLSHWEHLHQKQKTKRLKLKIFLFLLVAGLLVSGYLILFSDFFTIDGIDIAGLQATKPEQLQASVASFFEKQASALLPSDNLLFLSNERLSSYLKDEYPHFAKVEIQKVLFNKLKIVVAEREPVFIVCPTNQASACFYIDKTGFAYIEAPIAQGSLITTIEMANTLAPHTPILEAKLVERLLTFRDLLEKNLALPTQKIIVDNEVVFQTYEGWQVRLDKSTNFVGRFEDLALLLSAKLKGDRQKLEYIDLTIPNRAYYK